MPTYGPIPVWVRRAIVACTQPFSDLYPPVKTQWGPIRIKVAGATYRQLVIVASTVGDLVDLVQEPTNEHDQYAIKLINRSLVNRTGSDGWMSYVPRQYSHTLSEAIRSGIIFTAKVNSVGRAQGMLPFGASISLEH